MVERRTAIKSLMVLSSVSLGNFPPDDPRPRFRSSRRETITSSEVERMASVLTVAVTDQFSNTHVSQTVYDLPVTGEVCPIRCTRYGRNVRAVDCISPIRSYLDSLSFDVSLPDGLAEYNAGRSDEVSEARVNIGFD